MRAADRLRAAGGFREGDLSLLNYILLGDWVRGLNRFALCAGLTVLLAVFMISYLLRQVLILVTLTLSRKGETVCWLVYDFAAYLLLFVAIYFIFGYAGFPTSTVLTSVGLATLAVTLGAQGLVADVLAGIAIAFEGDFNVGDIVEVEGFLGTVKEIGIRTTKIVNVVNDIRIVQNSQIKTLINKAAYHSVVTVMISISAKESLPRVEKILAENLPRIGQENDKILSDPLYLGVSNVGDRTIVPYEPSMELLIIAPCREEDRFQVTRDMNREILLLFEREKVLLR